MYIELETQFRMLKCFFYIKKHRLKIVNTKIVQLKYETDPDSFRGDQAARISIEKALSAADDKMRELLKPRKVS